jgi:hypothetical protein
MFLFTIHWTDSSSHMALCLNHHVFHFQYFLAIVTSFERRNFHNKPICLSNNGHQVIDILVSIVSWLHSGSQDSSVSIVMGYRLEGLGSIPGSARFFSSLQHPDRLWGPLSLLSNGYQGLFPRGCKAAQRVGDHSPPSRAEVKKSGTISPLPFMSSWHSAYLIKHRDFIFTLVEFLQVWCILRRWAYMPV